jgi:hypothetical protein
MWCGLALPKPPHEIGNLLHGAHSERGLDRPLQVSVPRTSNLHYHRAPRSFRLKISFS